MQARHQVPGVFYLVWDQPLIAAGSASFIGDVLRLSGARNLVPDATQPFPHVSLEYLLKSDPEVLILPESLASRIQLNRSPFNRLQAVQGHRVLRLPDDLISRPAPRILQAMSQIIDFLHRKG